MTFLYLYLLGLTLCGATYYKVTRAYELELETFGDYLYLFMMGIFWFVTYPIFLWKFNLD